MGLGHLRRFQQLVDEVGKVGGGGNNLAVDGVDLDALKPHPGQRDGVVIGGVDVLRSVAQGQARGVVGHTHLGIGREVFSAR